MIITLRCTRNLNYIMYVKMLVDAPRERVWVMAIEQFVAMHRGVHTNHSTVFSHMIPD